MLFGRRSEPLTFVSPACCHPRGIPGCAPPVPRARLAPRPAPAWRPRSWWPRWWHATFRSRSHAPGRPARSRTGRRGLQGSRLHRRCPGRPRGPGAQGSSHRVGFDPAICPTSWQQPAASLGQTKASAVLARTNYDRANKLAPTGRGQPARNCSRPPRPWLRRNRPRQRPRPRSPALAIRLGETAHHFAHRGSHRRPPARSGCSGRASRRRRHRHRGPAPIACAVFHHSQTSTMPQAWVWARTAHVELDALPGRTFPGKVGAPGAVLRSADAHAGG